MAEREATESRKEQIKKQLLMHFSLRKFASQVRMWAQFLNENHSQLMRQSIVHSAHEIMYRNYMY